MKTNAFRAPDYKFQANLFSYKEASNGDLSATRTYYFNRVVNLLAVSAPGGTGKLTLFFGDDASDVRQYDQLMNFVGPDGVELHTAGVWMIEFAGPNINIWGNREGVKAKASLFAINA